MNRSLVLFIVCAVSLAFPAGGTRAADFCVSNTTQLQAALTTAQFSSQDDIIKVVQGTYIGNFTYRSNESKNITLEGGYATGCASRRVVDPTKTVLDGNHAGGVLLLSGSGSGNIKVDGFTIQNGSTTAQGAGGVRAYLDSGSGPSGAIILTNNIITGNSIASGLGGGVFASSHTYSGPSGAVTLANNTITGNSASAGGGILAYSGSGSGPSGAVTLTNNIITGNSATFQDGGGVAASSYSGSGPSGAVTLTSNIITGNSAVSGKGGGVVASSYPGSGPSGAVTLTNNTITGNKAASSRGLGGGAVLSAVLSFGTKVNCYNNIIWGNIATTGGDIVVGSASASNGYNNDYATMSGSWTNSGNNINTDPLFVNADSGNYHLRPASPCIDKGDNNAPGIPSKDFDGNKRIIDGNNGNIATVDMGAYEYVPSKH